MMTMEEETYIEVDGHRIHYRVEGEGPPLVFVHGWTLDLSYWDAQAAHFSRNYRVYRYDWRGMGESSGATPPFTMEQLGQELGGFIEKMGVRHPVICGHSEGGAIVLQYVAVHPGAVAAVVLADTDLNRWAEFIPGVRRFWMTKFFVNQQMKKGKNPLEPMIPNLEANLYSPGFVASHGDFMAAWRKQFLGNSPEGVVNGLGAWTWRANAAKPLANLKAPVLLLWGQQDMLIRLGEIQSVQASLGGLSQLSTLAGSGHMTPVEVPEKFNEVMETFLQQHVLR
jgi:pimeloyl-ACP methyl ester carboxylesterase